ncbi:TPA: ATP-binding cassette domain-containing protein [Klebsiella pneumoniae]|nr:ATP-binding cassette domain-containing protein [Klebsiella pneumoniae]
MVSNLVGGDAAMIELEQLVAGYDGVAITPPLSGMICPGSLTAIVGLNGCGKSTLLKTLAGFLPPVSGRLRWQGKRPVIGWLAQRHALESQFPLNVQDVVSQGAWPGVSLLAMTLGGFIAGIVVALVAGWVSRRTPLKEDASFAGFYLGSLALGVTLVSLRGSSVDLLHLLFGSILAVDRDAALFVSGVASLTLLCIALCYRGLVSEAFDSAWLQVNHRRLPALLHGLFLALLVLNLVAGFQVLGTLMAVGVMMLPAVAARCWARTLPGILLLAAGMGALCAWLGLSLSWAISLPAGPAIVLTASALFFVSLFFGTRSRLLVGWRTLMG